MDQEYCRVTHVKDQLIAIRDNILSLRVPVAVVALGPNDEVIETGEDYRFLNRPGAFWVRLQDTDFNVECTANSMVERVKSIENEINKVIIGTLDAQRQTDTTWASAVEGFMKSHSIEIDVVGSRSLAGKCTCGRWFRKVSKKSVAHALSIVYREYAYHLQLTEIHKQ